MRRILLGILVTTAVLAAASPITSATAGMPSVTSGAWVGKATSTDGTFNYGTVTFTVRGDTVRNFVIDGVTTSCGLSTIAMNPMAIKANSVAGAYQPVKGADQVVTVRGKFSAKGLTGSFTAGPLCTGKGIFTAKPR